MKRAHGPAGEVDVRVKGKNLTITPALHDQVVEKMRKLDKYLDRLQGIDVELSTEKTREADRHNVVEATTHVAGRTIRACTEGADMYAAIDEAVDKLYRQLNRQKERMKSHHGGRAPEVLPVEAGVDLPADVGEINEPLDRVIRIERLDVKPQFEDEAIDELESSGKQFHVFVNAQSEQVNVVYRDQSGGYVLVKTKS